MPASTTSGQRFTQLIQQLGLTKNAFAQSLGKTATVIQHIVDERNKPGFDLLNRVCEVYPNVSSDWLVLGKGAMLRADAWPQSPAAPTEAQVSSASVITAPAAPLDGIDLSEVPGTPTRRRNGALLQPADIAATLNLAAQTSGKNSQAAPAAAAPLVPASALPPMPAPSLPPTSPAPPLTAPDPAYLSAALHTMQLQHQLALAEQRNQHLLEQQALLKQLVQLLQAA